MKVVDQRSINPTKNRDFVKYMKKQTGPAAVELTAQNYETLIKGVSNKVIFAGDVVKVNLLLISSHQTMQYL